MITIDFTGRTALVTGAGRGIGRAIALKLAGAGCNVAVNYCSDSDSAAKVRDEIETLFGKKAILVRADIRNYDEVKNMVQKTVEEFGTIDFLINNSGVTSVTGVENLVPEEWKRVLDVNLTGTFYCCRECIPVMKKNGGGRIVNISSAAALTGRGGGAHYAATKGGM
ncbi:MAG: SDR family NAD(P)-dependent oxidoreductase, partial [Actinobacteria bacterium]|nr:SDR family NAD(P)-dependent oxidoreductase [Actinomycetota bacterium]